MKKPTIYFAASIRAGRADAPLYKEIILGLQQCADVLTEHVGDPSLSASGEERRVEDIYARDMDWLTRADAVVAEVTTPSLGVGYEIASSERLGKPVLCLYRPQPDRRLSAMIVGSPHCEVFVYQNAREACKKVKAWLTTLPL